MCGGACRCGGDEESDESIIGRASVGECSYVVACGQSMVVLSIMPIQGAEERQSSCFDAVHGATRPAATLSGLAVCIASNQCRSQRACVAAVCREGGGGV